MIGKTEDNSMAKKTILSISMVALGVISGVLVIFVYAYTGGNPSITLVFLAAAIACIIGGTILGFSQLLDRFVNPVLDEINQDIQDDIQDLKSTG
jgi:hypothetical protein